MQTGNLTGNGEMTGTTWLLIRILEGPVMITIQQWGFGKGCVLKWYIKNGWYKDFCHYQCWRKRYGFLNDIYGCHVKESNA